jgi:methyl-accepting chemotaxis protein
MTLRSRLLLAAAATVVVVLGISEVLAQRQAAVFFQQHELRLAQGRDYGALLSALQVEKRTMVWEMAALRLVSGAVAVAALSAILGVLWNSMISRPIGLLLDKMAKMSRGTWNQPIPVEQDDEIGRLLREFNLLGPRLTFAAHQYAAASKLAAMALIGQRVVRKANAAQQQLWSVHQALSKSHPTDTADHIRAIAIELYTMAQEFDAEFQAELERQGGSTASRRSSARLEEVEAASGHFATVPDCGGHLRNGLSVAQTSPFDR